MISGFDVLSISGEIKRRCKRCSYLNGEKDVVCGQCACALVANPCVDVDEQIAMYQQHKEEVYAWQARLAQEKKRKFLTNQTISEKSQMFATDVDTLVDETCEANEVATIPEASFVVHVSRFMDYASAFAFGGESSVSLAYFFSSNRNGVVDEIRKGGLREGARISSDMEAAFLYQGNGFIAATETGCASLPAIPEDMSSTWSSESSLSGWIVAILEGSRESACGIRTQNVKGATGKDVEVKILDRPELALPLVHFAAYKRRDDSIRRVFRGEYEKCIMDYDQHVQKDNVPAHKLLQACPRYAPTFSRRQRNGEWTKSISKRSSRRLPLRAKEAGFHPMTRVLR